MKRSILLLSLLFVTVLYLGGCSASSARELSEPKNGLSSNKAAVSESSGLPEHYAIFDDERFVWKQVHDHFATK